MSMHTVQTTERSNLLNIYPAQEDTGHSTHSSTEGPMNPLGLLPQADEEVAFSLAKPFISLASS